jgi:hypothetical protein
MSRLWLVASYILVPFFAGTFAEGRTNSGEKILGLVEVPQVFGEADPSGPPGQTQPKKVSLLKLQAEPGKNSKVVMQLSKPDEIVSREHGYEQSSAVVYARKGGWYMIQTKTGKGWLAPEGAGRFRSYEELLKDEGYLNKNWNGRLYSSPGAAKYSDQLVFEDKDQGAYAAWMLTRASVRILSKKKVAEELWVQVQLFEGGCGAPEVLGKKGWVPVYNEAGAENLWFHSRGC